MMNKKKYISAFLFIVILFGIRSEASTIDSQSKYAYCANLGFINMEANVSEGLILDEYVVSGYAYSANVGWIHFGDGSPQDGIQYSNANSNDCGVYLENYNAASGSLSVDLRGYAYGANIGWISFSSNGNPQLDLSTGSLKGYAYGANVGWINIGELGVEVKTTLSSGEDSDSDGIADAYEYINAGGLNSMDALSDQDSDGQVDAAEYAAGTDPLDPNDNFVVKQTAGGIAANIYSVTFNSSLNRVYQIEESDDLITWLPVGQPVSPNDNSGQTQVLVSDSNANGKHFWRITAKLPLE